MNFKIDGWDELYHFIPISGIAGSNYSSSMESLLYKGFDYSHYQSAINSFFSEALTGPNYKNHGYKVGPINKNPLIKRFLNKMK